MLSTGALHALYITAVVLLSTTPDTVRVVVILSEHFPATWKARFSLLNSYQLRYVPFAFGIHYVECSNCTGSRDQAAGPATHLPGQMLLLSAALCPHVPQCTAA